MKRIQILMAIIISCYCTIYACTPEPVNNDKEEEEQQQPEEQKDTTDTPDIPGKQDEPVWDGNNVESDQDKLTYAIASDGAHIVWDEYSEKKLASSGGYARVIKLLDGNYMATYEDYRGNVVVSHCTDGIGKTWKDVRTSIPGYNWTGEKGTVWMGAANAEGYQLSNGIVLAACNYRPSKSGIGPYSIAVSRSLDGGYEWEPFQVIYEASSHSSEGCWEPAFVELPDGTVQVYFANEYPYTNNNDQEISMLESKDSGVTWSKEKKLVSYRQGHRDGMPVPVVIGDEIVVAIEDSGRGQLQPFTVRTKISDNWDTPVLASSENRNFCLSSKYSGNIYMGAPYLAVLGNGTTVVSYQTTENRSSNWELSCMEVSVGDGTARNFANPSRPFDVPTNYEGKWNSIMAWDDHTVLAVSTTNKAGGSVAPWIKKGYVFTEVTATEDSEEKDQFYIAVSDKIQMMGGVGKSGDKIVFKARVTDNNLFHGQKKSDEVTVFLNGREGNVSAPFAGVYKIKVSYDGTDISLWEGDNTQWTEINVRGIEAESTVTDNGYDLTITFDPATFKNYTAKEWLRVAFHLYSASNDYVGSGAMMPDATENRPVSWRLVHIK